MSSFAGFVRRYVVVALAVFALVAATFTPGTAAPREQPVTVIVRTTGEPVALQSAGKAQSGRAEARALEERLRAAHDRVLEEARTRGLSVAREHDYTSVYSGMAVRVAPSQVEQLRTLPGVVAVYPDTRYRADLDVSVPFIGAPKVWERTDAEGDNVTGKGTIVSVIDTGIDYTHPDLGGGFGPDHKVVAGYDFVNDDADPMDDNAHGTHVAGIIAGDGGIKGVAPGAELTAYKVLNERGFGELSDIMAAIDAASDPANPYRADVINMSLGAFGDGYDPLSQAANNASDAGVVVVASAGNSGPGYETVGSPAAAEKVLAVGASITGLTVPRSP
ncbi:MAG TPA: S8 family serine peptidase [Actinomycetota bacterium]|nr:S8 family serine peptidase [Actinomycetota bacterium]